MKPYKDFPEYEAVWVSEEQFRAEFAYEIVIPHAKYTGTALLAKATKWCIRELGKSAILDSEFNSGRWKFAKRVGEWGTIYGFDDEAIFYFKDESAAVHFRLRFT